MSFSKSSLAAMTLLALGASALLLDVRSVSQATAASKAVAEQGPKPVEESMHEFMEYVFQPTYKRLRQAMAAEPADNAVWKAIKSDSLILAEGGNLLLIRDAGDDSDDWTSHSVKVRELGGELYQAARKKDYATAMKHYKAMLLDCNACHQKFADGKYQLEP